MKKLDLKRQFHDLYTPSSRTVSLVRVPKLQYLMIDGQIEAGEAPGTSPGFDQAMLALYGIAYTMKFMLKLRPRNPIDYPVMALEGLWWVSDGQFDITVKDNWLYTLMILTPGVANDKTFQTARDQVRRKRGENPMLERIRLERFAEGLCMQTMHIGPYAAEPATVERMKAFAAQGRYEDLVGKGGKHHEIYLGDPRKASPAKLKTILRHPVRRLNS
ncbi:MAG TPA: GyrI-like domain-containing protein [Anaerolineales bacterium]|nr:GyrI-like domain-containing protein [Anaerolineales bacterium]